MCLKQHGTTAEQSRPRAEGTKPRQLQQLFVPVKKAALTAAALRTTATRKREQSRGVAVALRTTVNNAAPTAPALRTTVNVNVREGIYGKCVPSIVEIY